MATMSHTNVVTFQIIFKDVQFLEKQTATLEIVNIGQVGNLFESSRFCTATDKFALAIK